MLQNPETKKKEKYHSPPTARSLPRPAQTSGEEMVAGIVPVLMGNSI
jgi:hypothetical protein